VPSPDSVLQGRTEPRLWTPPLRELTRSTSRGFEVADFADQVLGVPLLPWQRWLVIHALELDPAGGFRFRTVLNLVARQNGKTWLMVTMALWRLYVDGARLVVGAAQDLSIAREAWTAACDVVEGVPELSAEVDSIRRTNGDEYLKLKSGARYLIKAASRSAGRGLSVDQLMLDELREQRNWDAWSALSKTTQARPFAQTWGHSNAGDDESVVLNHLRDAAAAGRDHSIGLFEWSAEDGCELDDRDAIAQANPALGHTISLQAIQSSLGTDPPEVFRTEVLCQKVDALDSAIDRAGWKACRDPKGTLDGLRDRVGLCLDVAPDGEHVTLAAGAETDDGRIRVEIVQAWNSTDEARRDLPALIDRVNPRQVGWFPSGPAAALGAEMRHLDGRELKGAEVLEVCQELDDLVRSRLLLHPGDPLLDAHVNGARRLKSGDGWRFVRRGAGHVDAAYAAAGAAHIARTLPAEGVSPWIAFG
jgi:hypothetical protein